MNHLASFSHPHLSFAEECSRGKVREENQDTVLHARTSLGELSVVADGIGGLEGGAIASRIVVETIYEHLQTLPADYPATDAIREASAIANANILAAAAAPDSPYRRMGSTVVLALVQHDSQPAAQQDAAAIRARTQAWIGHIGDSRAYLLRDGRIGRITKDHSAVQELIDQGLLAPEQAGNHPDASVLTRSLGHYAEVEIDIDAVPLLPGDSLLLCSDGLWGFVPEQEIQTVMADAHLPIEATAKALLEMALAAGGHDNIGIELIRVDLPPAPAAEAVQPPLEAQQPTTVLERYRVDGHIQVEQPHAALAAQVTSTHEIPEKEIRQIQQPHTAQASPRPGFAAILLLGLLGGAAVGAVLYFAFYGH